MTAGHLTMLEKIHRCRSKINLGNIALLLIRLLLEQLENISITGLVKKVKEPDLVNTENLEVNCDKENFFKV